MSPYHRTAVFSVASALLSVAGMVRADIVECVDQSGAVTFTDVPCRTDADSARGAARFGQRAPKERLAPSPEKLSTPQQARAAKFENRPPPYLGLETDVATLKAAKESMIMMDRASTMLRHQSLASRD